MSSFTSNSDLTPRRFVAWMAASFVLCFGSVWLWVLAMPLAFLDPEYPAWRAKQLMLTACDLGEVLVIGDSRAATGLMPAGWPVAATNLAVGGGEPIEALAALDRALRCKNAPRQIIISFDATHFTKPDLFWERTVRFGFVDGGEIATLRRVSQALDDLSVYELRHTDGLPSWMRDRLYQIGFPAYWFGSLVKGGVFLRWPRNRIAVETGLAARGHYLFGTASGSAEVAAEGKLREFQPLPVLDWYFNEILQRLAQRGIPAVFLAMPMNDATAAAVAPAVRTGFRAWLSGYEARYPGFRVVGDTMPAWPDTYFGDGFSHLNPGGARHFNTALADCLNEAQWTAACVQRLQDAPPNTQNEAQNGWFSDTGPAAAVKVRPISKRGS